MRLRVGGSGTKIGEYSTSHRKKRLLSAPATSSSPRVHPCRERIAPTSACRTRRRASRAIPHFGQEKLEIDVLGKALDQTVRLGQACTARKDRLRPPLIDPGNRCDHSDRVPILLHEGRIDAEFGGDRVKQLTIRESAQRKRTCRCNRSFARCVPLPLSAGRWEPALCCRRNRPERRWRAPSRRSGA